MKLTTEDKLQGVAAAAKPAAPTNAPATNALDLKALTNSLVVPSNSPVQPK